MRSFTCVSVVVYVASKIRPCPSYNRRRDRINLVLWRSLDKGGGGYSCLVPLSQQGWPAVGNYHWSLTLTLWT